MRKVYEEGEKDPTGFTVENTLNADDGKLPFGFYNPDTEGKVTWICDYGTKGDIISVFAFDSGDGAPEKKVSILKDMKEASFCREELLKAGWKKLVPPKISFTTTRDDGTKAELNRQQKRTLAKKMKKINKTVAK